MRSPQSRLMAAYHSKLFRRWVKRLTIVLGMIVLSLGTIMLNLALYSANSGTADYGMVFGRHLAITFTCGTQTPGFNPSGNGTAVFHGEPQPMKAIHVYGPVRPEFSTTVSTNDLQDAGTAAPNAASITRHRFVWTCVGYVAQASWRIYASELFLLSVSLAALLGFKRRDLIRPLLKLSVVSGSVLTLVWVGSLGLTVLGSAAIDKVHQPTDMFNYAVTRILPAPAKQVQLTPIIAFDGDSRFSGWNPDKLVANPTPNDVTCHRTRSNVAAQVAQRFGLQPGQVLDNACPGADVDMGIVTQEQRDGRFLPEQFSLDGAAPNLQYVVVDPGMNGVGWGLLAGGAKYVDLNIAPVPVAVKAAIDHMRPALEDLLSGYRNLRGPPHVIIVGSYTVFDDGATCAESQGYFPDEITLMNQENTLINQFLAKMAADNGADFVLPHLTPLCSTTTTGQGPDIMGIGGPYQFHPTPLGELKIAEQVEPYIHFKPIQPSSSGSGGPIIGSPPIILQSPKPLQAQP